MGCGVSKFDHAAGGGGWRQLSIVHKKSDAAVVDNILLSKSLPEGREGEGHAKGRGMHKKVNSDEKGGMQRGRLQSSNKDESLEDDGYIPQSLSFRVYCISSLEDDNNQGDGNAEKMMDKQEGDGESNKGSSTRVRRRAKIGKGIKTILRA
ncbi:hypothetical protein J1N35_040641 [Gossypium stocksii]|uniref:Uncharacterized protein n=1 Tax=Gossypium stocksii TaxID=47602 RepID=A0A9D3UEH2_9ROSI|nr:hypothetical protein J1N35_040641 [Gossypium stocksii]